MPFLAVLRARLAAHVPTVALVALLGCGGGATTPAATPATPAATPATPTATGPDTFATQKTGPIAPGCAKDGCAEVDLDVKLACRDTTSELDYTQATRIVGKTDQVSCAGNPSADGKGMDLRVGLSPNGDASEEVAGSNEIWFQLRNYTGPGTYPLVNLVDEGDYMGLKILGKTAGHTEKTLTVGTVSCIPTACEAIVAEGSQPIPNDEMSTHEFRVRVEIRCARGGSVGNLSCEAGNTRCTFSETPTLLADLACRQ